MPAETAGSGVGSAVWIWLVMRMEDGLDWQHAHMGSGEIIMGGGWGRGLITKAGTVLSAWCAVQPLPLQLRLRISQHAYASTGSGDQDLLVSVLYMCEYLCTMA